MSITILKQPVIDYRSRCSNEHAPFRNRFYWDCYSEKYARVVKGEDVIEIGPGLFGGSASLALRFGCNSFTGIDITTGDSDKEINAESSTGRIDYTEKIPYQISISPKIVNDPKVRFLFGMDAYSYLKDNVDTGSVVTVSSGLFHDYILMPNDTGTDYVVKLIHEISRVSKRGQFVGIHHFMRDANNKKNLENRHERPGPLFRKIFKKFGVTSIPVTEFDNGERYALDELWFLNKN